MENLQTSIANAIKTRSSTKRADGQKRTPFNYKYACKEHPESIN